MPQIATAPSPVRNSSVLVASPEDYSPKELTLADGPSSVAEMTVIPPEHKFRTLVLCFDGTGDQFDSDNSNIVQFFSLLPKEDREKQMVYYQAGIGTYTSPQVATPFMSKVFKLLDDAIAWNLDTHVMGGYEFLMQNYTVNDRICIFGFSRGAYTARSLAGMLHKVGLLPPWNRQFAYKMFKSRDEAGWKQSNIFKKTFSIDVPIEFIGVWDTVNSVGLVPRRLPFTTSNTIVRTFRHAVSLDERRAKFKPNLWNRPDKREKLLSVSDQKKHHHHVDAPHPTKKISQRMRESTYDGEEAPRPTDVEEVWFAGCHCDVGGGSVDNDTRINLARIPLRWMVRECFKTDSGIMFDTEGLRGIGLEPETLYPVVKPRPAALPVGSACIQSIPRSKDPAKVEPALVPDSAGSDTLFVTEEELDLRDALSPIYDQLSQHWPWWILELMPLKHHYQCADDTWSSFFGWNLGNGRRIPKHINLRVHRSVKTRMEAKTEKGGTYRPKAAFDLERVTWVD
ncbi:hypothetical protein K438DRAFT_1853048 [Mycena galopus ATCC 62051]|nr:hypothetical protein K438DRAFT_1853048 [Mycena galopus ATCC 62051]